MEGEQDIKPLLSVRKKIVDFDDAGNPLIYGRRVSAETFIQFCNINLCALEQVNGNLLVRPSKDDYIKTGNNEG